MSQAINQANTAARPSWRVIRSFHAAIDFPRRRITGFLALNLAILCCQLPTPFVVSRIINALGSGGNLPDVLPLVGAALALMLATLMLSTWVQIVITQQTLHFGLSLRARMFADLVDNPTSNDDERPVSDMHARFGNDVGMLAHLWPTGIATNLRHGLTLLLAAAALLYISVPLTLCIAGFLPLAILLFRYFGRRLSVLAAQAQAGLGAANGVLLESLHSAGLAQILGTRSFHLERLRGALEASNQTLYRARVCSAMMGFALGVLPLLVSAVIWIVGGQNVHQGDLTAGDLVAFALVLSILYAPINGLFSAASGVIFEYAALLRILDILKLVPRRLARKNAVLAVDVATPSVSAAVSGPAGISLQGVSFARGERQLFDNLNLDIPAGACVALEGRNGTGKSTLMTLIFGAQPDLWSRILLHGVPLAGIDPTGRSRMFGYLPQDVMIYSDTLRNNVAMGRDISDEAIFGLASELGLKEFLLEWPDHLDTSIQEGGRNLSGGQKQRIALLRALSGSPPILLMDEPEQTLDQQSLADLVSYLQRIKHRSTCVIATHCESFRSIVDRHVELPYGNV